MLLLLLLSCSLQSVCPKVLCPWSIPSFQVPLPFHHFSSIGTSLPVSLLLSFPSSSKSSWHHLQIDLPIHYLDHTIPLIANFPGLPIAYAAKPRIGDPVIQDPPQFCGGLNLSDPTLCHGKSHLPFSTATGLLGVSLSVLLRLNAWPSHGLKWYFSSLKV